MARRQPSLIIILIALLVWLIVFYSEVVLMLIATTYVAAGVALHVVRVAAPSPGIATRQDMSSPQEAVRVAIAGAASLRGKELKQWLEESNFPAAEIRLLDEEVVAGTLTEAGGRTSRHRNGDGR